MKTFFTALATVSAIALCSGAAFAADGPENSTKYEAKDNGGYSVESKSELTTKAGTDKSGKHSVDVDVSDEGKVSKDIENKSSTDPEGLMNAKSTTKSSTYDDKDNGGYEAKDVSKHKDADGTNVTTKVETDVDVDDNGAVDKTVTKTKVVDPKGLMNKEKSVVKTVNGKIVDQD